MGKRIFKKCLSIALSSSLVLSPAFAANEQFIANGNNIKTEEQKEKPSTIKQMYNVLRKNYLKIGTFVTAAALFVIVDQHMKRAKEAELKREAEREAEMARERRRIEQQKLEEEEKERQREEKKRLRFEERENAIKEKIIQKSREIEQCPKLKQLYEWQDHIYDEKGIKIFEKFFRLVENKGKWKSGGKRYVSYEEYIEMMMDIRSLWPVNDQKTECGQPALPFVEYCDLRWCGLNDERKNLLIDEVKRIKELSQANNHQKYREYRDRESAEFTLYGDYDKERKKVKADLEKKRKEDEKKLKKAEALGDIKLIQGLEKSISNTSKTLEGMPDVENEQKKKSREVMNAYGNKRLTSAEKEEYKRLQNKCNEVLSVIDNIVNSHENHCTYRFGAIIDDVARELDSLEESNMVKQVADERDICEEVEDYMVSRFRQALYDKSFAGSKAAAAREMVMSKEKIDTLLGKGFNVNANILTYANKDRYFDDLDKENILEVKRRMVENFDLDLLRETALDKEDGISQKFKDAIIGYKDKCMKNEVSFKEYCVYARKNEEDFKTEINALINFYQESKEKEAKEKDPAEGIIKKSEGTDPAEGIIKKSEGTDPAEGIIKKSEGTDPAETMKKWVSGSIEKLSFEDLKTNAYNLDCLYEFEYEGKKCLGDMFPGLDYNKTEEDVANVLMIADMVKNKYFEVDIK